MAVLHPFFLHKAARSVYFYISCDGNLTFLDAFDQNIMPKVVVAISDLNFICWRRSTSIVHSLPGARIDLDSLWARFSAAPPIFTKSLNCLLWAVWHWFAFNVYISRISANLCRIRSLCHLYYPCTKAVLQPANILNQLCTISDVPPILSIALAAASLLL